MRLRFYARFANLSRFGDITIIDFRCVKVEFLQFVPVHSPEVVLKHRIFFDSKSVVINPEQIIEVLKQ